MSPTGQHALLVLHDMLHTQKRVFGMWNESLIEGFSEMVQVLSSPEKITPFAFWLTTINNKRIVIDQTPDRLLNAQKY